MKTRYKPVTSGVFFQACVLNTFFGKTWMFEADGEYRYADEELEGIADGKDGYSVFLGFRKDF